MKKKNNSDTEKIKALTEITLQKQNSGFPKS